MKFNSISEKAAHCATEKYRALLDSENFTTPGAPLPALVYAGALLATVATPALALEPVIANPIDRTLHEQQQQRLLDNARTQRQELGKQQPAAASAPRHRQSAATRLNVDAARCVDVADVTFHGADTLPRSVKLRIHANYSGRCLQQADLDRLLDEVNDWYVEHGYITSHAELPRQNLDGAVLVVEAVEGKLGRIYFAGNDYTGDQAARLSFPGSPGDVLNLRNIEQGVEQIERVAPTGVKVAIRPAPLEGYSDVVLTGSAAPNVGISLSADNNGAENTGRNEIAAALTLNNTLGFGEQIQFSADTTAPIHADRFRRNFGVNASLPVGYWTFSYSASGGNYAIPLDFYGLALNYHGSSIQHRFTASRTVQRNARSKTDVFASLSHYRGDVYLDEFALQNSSERQSAAQLGISYATRVGSDSYFTAAPVFTQGLAPGSTNLADAGGPNAHFRKAAVSASFYKALTPRVAFLSSAYGQWSPDALYGSERVTVGSDASVRGFRDRYLYGNTGAYWRNQIDWRAPAPSWAGRVTLSAAVDAGRVVPVAGEPLSGGTVLGAALAASTAYRNVAGSVSVGTPLRFPAQLKADPIVVNVKLTTSF